MFTICTLTVPVTANIICLFFIYRLITSLISNKFYASLPLFFWFSFTDLIKHLLLPFSISDNHTFILYLLISDVSLKLSIKVTFELLRDIGVLKFAYQFMFRKANLYEVQFINSRRSREIHWWLSIVNFDHLVSINQKKYETNLHVQSTPDNSKLQGK